MERSAIIQATQDTIMPHIEKIQPLTGELRKGEGNERWVFTIDTREEKPVTLTSHSGQSSQKLDTIQKLYDWAGEHSIDEVSVMLVSESR